jgi:hypothetical protein
MIIDILKFILVFPFVFILPGFFFLLAIFGRSGEKISFFERAVLIVPSSLILVDFSVLIANKMGIPISGIMMVGVILIISLLSFIVYQHRFQKKKGKKEISSEEVLESEKLFDFSFWQAIFILVSLVLAIFVRTAYLADTIVPSSTDLGHHMYWVQTIIDSGRLPNYGMPDFIIGEHIIFAVFNLISGLKVMSAFPSLILFFMNITGIFTLAILVARLFKKRTATAMSFFAAGVLYAISAPQGKYISGGVVGNVIGDMLIPVVLYFLYRALKEKNSVFAGLFVFSAAGLFYTHHLSGFIFLYSMAAIILAYLALNFRRIFEIIGDWLKIFLKPFPLAILAIGIFVLIFIYTPSFLDKSAIGQATGTPSKDTRVGLTLDQIEMNVGSARLLLGAIGLIILILKLKPKKYKYSFSLGWAAILLLMAYKPGWIYVNIPSSRIGNYLFLPFSLISAYALAKYFELFKRSSTKFFASVLLYTLLFFVITDGLSDSADAFKTKNQYQEAVQTFHSAAYLAQNLDTSQDVLLKDHVSIYGDSWYKLFFMKDYKYPLSRGLLSRYIDPTKPRETCTRDMISTPETESAKFCFSETGVNYLALNAQLEGNSFEKYPDFSKVYSSNYISVFRKD